VEARGGGQGEREQGGWGHRTKESGKNAQREKKGLSGWLGQRDGVERLRRGAGRSKKVFLGQKPDGPEWVWKGNSQGENGREGQPVKEKGSGAQKFG